ncbi:uncharacterized protein [Takifugu rubripes]|uniref:uncharacterized protein n=1 Tax=Takifugu rubripes TaxID=31033 RepID=UPI001145B218|nr:uncharacterized protein LOC115250054 [Takifugu rubripes]
MEKMTTQETLRQLRQIVYKLTPENFDELMESVADLKFDTVKKLWESIKLIFFKVVLKPSSIGLYAKMCCCLKELRVDTMTGESVTFCTLLETHCQQQLKKVHSGDEDLNQKEKVLVSEQNEAKFRNLKLELEEARLKVHRRLLISMKFIGELFKVKMLTLDKVQTFVLELLRDDQRELPMKCLCMLLFTIGEELDTGNTKPLLDDYCCKLENIATENKTSLSIQHILRDVLDLRKNNWVVPLHKEVAQTLKPMHEEGKFEDQRDPKQRKGRGGMTDQMTQTRPMTDHNRNRSVKNKGPLSSNSLSCRCDGNRYHISPPGRGRDRVKLKEHSSDFEKWCKRRAYTSAYRSDGLVGYNRPHSDRSSDNEKWQKIPACGSSSQGDQPVTSGGHRVNRLIRMWENCIAGKDLSQESVQHVEHSSDIDQPVVYKSRRHSNMHGDDKFTRASNCETCCSRNDCRRDSVQNNERTSNIEKWHKRNPSHGSVWPVSNNGPYGDGYWFNPFKRASYGKNWHLRNGHNKNGFKDPNHSSDCENGQKKNPHNPSRHTIWANFNRKLNHRSHRNRQAVAQFKSDCENWRSGNDRNRDHVDHQKGSPNDKNWRSSKRDQAERCDRSPDQHKVIEHRVADSNGEKKETEVQHMRNADEHQCSPPPPLSTSMLAPV